MNFKNLEFDIYQWMTKVQTFVVDKVNVKYEEILLLNIKILKK